jgi:pimeloyl-ACP methyl ester carboxylesterase
MWHKAFIVFLCMIVGSCMPAQESEINETAVKLTAESDVCVVDGCASERNAVVFVHGLTGSSESWKNRNFNWPKEFAKDPLLSNYDVYQIEYESYRFRESVNLTDINSELVTLMSSVSKKDYKSIAFVAHSLGGNIVRRYLQTLKSRAGHHALNRYRVIVLLGTPMGGSGLANIFENISRNAQVRTLVEIDENDYLQLMNEQLMGTVAKHENSGCSTLRFYSAYEKKPSRLGIVVPMSSATEGAYACEGFESNHSDLAKPESSASAVYTKVRDLLSACAEDGPDVCPKPEPGDEDMCGRAINLVDANPSTPHCHQGWELGSEN